LWTSASRVEGSCALPNGEKYVLNNFFRGRANFVVWLLSAEARYVNRSSHLVDAGAMS
jgi:hypothetical protein